MSPSGPLALPAELRLDIYRHVVADVLAGGSSSDLFGLYISCHEMQRELEHDFISKVRPFLSVQSTWKKMIQSLGHTPRNPLRLEPTYQGHGPNALLPKLHIALPFLQVIFPAIDDRDREFLLASLLRILRPLLQGPCPTLTITLCQEKRLDISSALETYGDFIAASQCIAEGTTRYFKHTK